MPKYKSKLTYKYENRFIEKYRLIAGVDEAGVGPLAGPVVAAAVVLKPNLLTSPAWWGLIDDSKKLNHEKRELAAKQIVKHALMFGIGSATVLEIDELNILQARLLAMKRAVGNLKNPPSLLLIDGNKKLADVLIDQQIIVRGDEKILSIAAASILAKVTRDNMLLKLHKQFPQYGFDRHKGYPTLFHKEMIRTHGPCEEHRKTFWIINDLVSKV